MNAQQATTAIKELNMITRPHLRFSPPSVEQVINALKVLSNKLIVQLDIINPTLVSHHVLSVKLDTSVHQLLELQLLLKE